MNFMHFAKSFLWFGAIFSLEFGLIETFIPKFKGGFWHLHNQSLRRIDFSFLAFGFLVEGSFLAVAFIYFYFGLSESGSTILSQKGICKGQH